MRTGIVVVALLSLQGCSIQSAYWGANTSVGLQAEKEGKIDQAETELRLALVRARNHLTPEDVSNSLYNLGQFYKRQKVLSDAIRYLSESLQLEETLSGPASERTGRRLAELAIVHWMDGNINEGRVLAERLRPLAVKFQGQERTTVDGILSEYFKDPATYAADIARLEALVAKGDPVAECELAGYYENGYGVKQEYDKALALFLSSASRGYVNAQYYLGVKYDKGRGVKVDDSEARRWYRIAAEQDHKIAQFNYAVLLIQGRGGPKDETVAMDWLRKSSEQGYPSAIYLLKDLKSRMK